ncbi:MAG: ribonuclease Z [Tannerellaceae bacterium]|nr:ribonuclease Z [Tannerellaceae bacterium]
MLKFEVNILGCGSALPTTKHNLSSQVLNINNHLYMVDCGEGTQLQLRRLRLNFNRLQHIFISHLHGDHFFGLPGLISTFSLLGRTSALTIHAEKELGAYLIPILDKYCKDRPFELMIHSIDPEKHEVVWEDKTVTVYSIPLKHRVPTCGFLFREKPREPHLIKEMIDFYKIPVKELQLIKRGADFITSDGEVVANKRLTKPALPPRSYAYCSDTAYNPEIIPFIQGVDMLYHEATFAEKDKERARQTCHSTAIDAATIAREAKAGKLVLGHFSARYEDEAIFLSEAKTVFENTQLAGENSVIVL